MPATNFKVKISDMATNESTFILDAANLLLEKIVTQYKPKQKHKSDEVETEFVQSLKVVLDQRFGPEWTVVGGLDFGFALKSRKKSAAILNGNLFGRNFQVVAYRSPGHEVFSNAVVAEIANRKMLNFPKISPSAEEISDLISALSPDHQVAAQRVRDLVSAATELSIWHVLVGTNFRVAFPVSRSHELDLLVGNSRVLLFRHQQEASKKLLEYLPVLSKFLMVLFCFVLLFQARIGVSDNFVQAAGLGVLGLAVCKVLYALFLAKHKNA